MPHSVIFKNVGIFICLNLLYFNFFIAQNSFQSEKKLLYLPPVDLNNKTECSVIELSSKSFSLYFIKHSSNHYLKVFFEQKKDTVKTPPLEKYKTELEIKSGTKSYYKKEWSIYQESNQLFFVLLLPPNYLKTLSTDGITEILIGNKSALSLSKKESKQIKEIAGYLLNQ